MANMLQYYTAERATDSKRSCCGCIAVSFVKYILLYWNVQRFLFLLEELTYLFLLSSGEMLGIFDSITQLKLRVDMQLPVDEQWQHVSSSLSSSAVDEPVQQVSMAFSSSAVDIPPQQVPSILSNSAVDEPLQQVSPMLAFDEHMEQISSLLSSSSFNGPLQLVSSRLSSSVRSATSDGTSVESLASKNSWSSAESDVSLMDYERMAGVSVGGFALDESWDVVDDEEIIEAPIIVKSSPMLL